MFELIFIQSNISVNTNASLSSSTSSSSSSQKNLQRPVELQASHFHQFQNIRCRFEQMTSGTSNASTNNVRRYTSENNLNVLNATSKPILQDKSINTVPIQNTAISTDDLTKVPSWKKLSPQARLSALLDKTNHSSSSVATSLISNGTSASLIDLSSIDKLPPNQLSQPTARPRFRFVPSTDNNSILKEEPELEQQTTVLHQPYDNFDIQSRATNRTSISTQSQQPPVPIPTRQSSKVIFIELFL
jgi:hypothetical protein